jgi:hypothetical protein
MIAIYATAWLSAMLWAATNWLRLLLRPAAARLAWTGGALALLVHVLLALHFVHGWDHASLRAEIARRMFEQTGMEWDGGAYVNHAFTALWLLDAAWWWLGPHRYESRPRLVDGAVQFLALFMFVNATVIFGTTPPTVVAGTVVCAAAMLGWLGRIRQRADSIDAPTHDDCFGISSRQQPRSR